LIEGVEEAADEAEAEGAAEGADGGGAPEGIAAVAGLVVLVELLAGDGALVPGVEDLLGVALAAEGEHREDAAGHEGGPGDA
jgi:hypothetical protein